MSGTEIAIATNDKDAALAVTDPKHAYLKPDQVDHFNDQLRVLEKKLVNPWIQDKHAVGHQIRMTQKALDTQTAPSVPPGVLDEVAKMAKDLESQIGEGLLSAEEMRKNPPGAVRQATKWSLPENKQKVLRWRNCLKVLHPGATQLDVNMGSVEELRPAMSQLNMHNAQIPGAHHSVPSPQYMANYESVDWGEGDGKNIIAEIEKLKAALSELKGETNGGTTELDSAVDEKLAGKKRG